MRRASVIATATLVALFGGVQLAHAGLVDEVVEDPAAVVEDPVAEVTQAADDAVADAKQSVEEAVADAPGTAEAVTETAKDVVADTPAAPVVDEVEKAIDPIVGKAVEPVTALTGASAQPSGSASEPPKAETIAEAGETAAAAAADGGSALQNPFSPGQLAGEAGDAQPPISAGSNAPATSTPDLATGDLWQLPLSRAILPTTAPEPASDGGNGSSNAPFAPLAPLFPAETPATAAAAGAGGAALVVALLAAFMFLAPRTGRLARSGPILARPDPCLSLAEQPG